jgi:hypothetical protein
MRINIGIIASQFKNYVKNNVYFLDKKYKNFIFFITIIFKNKIQLFEISLFN